MELSDLMMAESEDVKALCEEMGLKAAEAIKFKNAIIKYKKDDPTWKDHLSQPTDTNTNSNKKKAGEAHNNDDDDINNANDNDIPQPAYGGWYY